MKQDKKKTNEKQKMDPRDISLSILMDIEENGVFSNYALSSGLRKIQFESKQDRAFVTRLVEGVTEYRLQLDAILAECSTTPIRKMKKMILSILRMTIYQILYMDSVPDHAAVSEAVRLAKKHKFSGLSGFVNAVSRKAAAKKQDGSVKEIINASLSVKYSIPREIAELLTIQYGEERTEKMLAASFTDRDTSIRVIGCNTDKAALIEKLEKSAVTVEEGQLSENALHISGYDFIRKVPGFRTGEFTVQDESSISAVEALEIKKEDKILELCAAPGGKSLYAAELAADGFVISRDLTEDKTELIRENAERLGITNIQIEEHDAALLDETLLERFDCVIADVPCSGLGVMGRKNDIKYHVTKEGMEELAILGLQILRNAGKYVVPGGKILFSTCTVNKKENEENVAAFLKENKDFSLVKERTYLQGIDPCDGFYFAVLKRQS